MMRKNKMIHDFSRIVDKAPSRSKISRNSKLTTAFNAGQLIPVYVDEILPGDFVNMDIRALIRQTTMLKPVMDVAYIDIAAFFVPMRIVWNGTKAFFGENEDEWAKIDASGIPQLEAPKGGWKVGSLADFMGIPPGKEGFTVNVLPFRAYAKIVNDWYRDENLQKSSHINYESGLTEGSNGDNYVIDLEKGGMPYIASKYHDYFTSGLPAPQKGLPVTLNIGGNAPVITGVNNSRDKLNLEPMQMTPVKSAPVIPANGLNMHVSPNASDRMFGKVFGHKGEGATSDFDLVPSNLYADLSAATGITINQLREAITYQQMLEKDARGGTRYVEYIKSHFGVDSPDSRQQRSEYLGGYHKPLNVSTVPNTGAGGNEPQANLAAFGESFVNQNTIKKTFTEHGYLLVLATIRYDHTYQQGIEPLWSRKDRNDFYDPIFANIGEQPIYNKEIFLQGTKVDDEIFAYNEAWANYRYKPNRVSGMMRSGVDLSLDYWHYADYYSTLPKLSGDWIKEDKNNIDRTLAVKSDPGENWSPQFQVDLYFVSQYERAMPVYSIPGLKRF